MNGTMTSAKLAMRLTPPKMIRPSSAATPRPIHSFRLPAPPTLAQASAPVHSTLTALSAMALACTPGSRKPAAMTVATANAMAYHFRPMAFSM